MIMGDARSLGAIMIGREMTRPKYFDLKAEAYRVIQDLVHQPHDALNTTPKILKTKEVRLKLYGPNLQFYALHPKVHC